MANNKLQNAIAFPPAGQFLISSSLQRSGNQRLEFQFLEASLLVSGRKIPLPPVGKGWQDPSLLLPFDSVLLPFYCCLAAVFLEVAHTACEQLRQGKKGKETLRLPLQV